MQSHSVSVTEIHQALDNRLHIKISRKTVERDMGELVDRRIVTSHEGIPIRFVLNKPNEVEIRLKREEIVEILRFLDPESYLHLKIKGPMS